MANCGMCGSEGQLYLTEIEGTKMRVCKECSGFGKVIQTPGQASSQGRSGYTGGPAAKRVLHRRVRNAIADDAPELVEMIVGNYSTVIRSKREKLGMTQKEFARHINEKESVLQNLEKSKLEPSLELAKKLQKILDITLIEEVEENPNPVINTDAEGGSSTEFTLGDFIKKR